MHLKKTGPNRWELTENLTISKTYELMKHVWKAGGIYLEIKNQTIDLRKTIKYWEGVELNLTLAQKKLTQSQTSFNLSESTYLVYEVRHAVRRAAANMCLFVRDVGIEEITKETQFTPIFIESNPELRKYWVEAYIDLMSQLYEEVN